LRKISKIEIEICALKYFLSVKGIRSTLIFNTKTKFEDYQLLRYNYIAKNLAIVKSLS